MIIGYDRFEINGIMMNVELVDKIPEGYNFIENQNGHDIYRKDEQFNGDINHYYLAI